MANFTVANGGGNINAGATYVGGVAPTSTDSIIFTATSGQLTVNTPFSIASIDFTNYTNTLTMSTTLTVSGNITLVPTMTIAGTGQITQTGIATLTSNGKTWGLPIQFTGTGVRTFADDWTVSNYIHGMSSGGALNGSNLNVTGNMSYTAGASAGTTQINIIGTCIWSGAGTVANNLTINTAGAFTISGNVTFGGGKTLKYITAGSVTTSTGTLTITTGITLDTNVVQWTNISTTGASGTFTLLSDFRVTNGFSTPNNAQTWDGFNCYTGGLSVGGSVLGTTKFIFNGTGSLSGGTLRSNTDINTTGTLTIGDLSYNTGTLTYVAGTVNCNGTVTISGSATLNTSGMSFNNVTLNTSLTCTINSLLTIVGTLNCGGSLNVNPAFAGTSGWTTNNLLLTSTSTNTVSLKNGITYTITGNFTSQVATNANKITIGSSVASSDAFLILVSGATQDVGFVNFTDVNASGGKTIFTYKGVLTRTTNINILPTDMVRKVMKFGTKILK